jgi:hypothetical protein
MSRTEELIEAVISEQPRCRTILEEKFARMLRVAERALWACIVIQKEPHAKRVCGDAMLEIERIAGA